MALDFKEDAPKPVGPHFVVRRDGDKDLLFKQCSRVVAVVPVKQACHHRFLFSILITKPLLLANLGIRTV